MRVHFINRFYWPAEIATAQLLTDLAEALAARGWTVSVTTGHPHPGLPRQELREGVEILRLGRPMSATQNLARRALDFTLFHLLVLPSLWRRTKRNDVIVALTDPPLIGVTAAIVAGLRGARLVHWVHDIYPEVVAAVHGGPTSKFATALLRVPRNAAWHRAAACVTLGRDMANQVRQAGVASDRTHTIPNWAPRGLRPPGPAEVDALRSAWDLRGRFVIGYSGNFGRVHDLGHILEVAARLRDDPAFVFLFVGGGAGFAMLKRGVEARGLLNVRFLPPRPRPELAASLGLPDVHLISLRAGCERLVFPSKLYGIAAAGRPVLLLATPDCEIARIVRDENLGLVCRPDAVDDIVGALRTLAADESLRRRCADAATRFDRAAGGSATAVRRWDAVLRDVHVQTVNRARPSPESVSVVS